MTHGWEFVANSPITVTQLGLFDYNNDGFDIDREIGLFRLRDAALLASGTTHAGAVDTLLGGFRYIDTPDVTLARGTSHLAAFLFGVNDLRGSKGRVSPVDGTCRPGGGARISR